MKKIIFIFIATLTTFHLFSAEEFPIGQLINLSARQRALSQKAMKSWVCKQEGIFKEASIKEQLNATNIFDQTLELMMEKAPNENLKLHFKKIENQWIAFKKLIEDNNNTNYAITLSASNNVLTTCEDALKATIKHSKELTETKGTAYDYATVISNTETCGKQRLLTQRLVIYYALHYTNKGANMPVNKSAIGILEELNDNFKRLMVSEINSSDIYDELSSIMFDWKKTYQLLKANNYEAIEQRKITVEPLFENMNKLYNKFDKLVTMYGNLLKK